MKVEIKPLKVRYQGKILTIDIQEELSINKNIIEKQLKDIPSSYYILCSIRDSYIHKRDLLEREKEEAYSKSWTFYKDSNSSWNNDYVSNKANFNNKYMSLCRRYLKAVKKASILINLCKAYEAREGILRTISANQRINK